MTGEKQLPEITLKVTGGSLTIRTAEAIFKVLVSSGVAPGTQASALPAPAAALPPELPPGGAVGWEDLDIELEEKSLSPGSLPPLVQASGGPEDEYYRQLSSDMYHEVGRLARRLSMSIRDVKMEKVEAIDFEAAGEQLESAKDELESVVKMTEKATNQIMDLGEGIQGALANAKGLMERITAGIEEMSQQESHPVPGEQAARKELAGALEKVQAFVTTVSGAALPDLSHKAAVLVALLKKPQALSPAPTPQAASPPSGPYYSFSPDLVFQTIYELCTNEMVKKHIKAMWDTGERGFDLKAVEKGINSLVKNPPDEDNFLNLDLPKVLKQIFLATKSEKFKQVIKKMAATVDQIFLEPVLPLEAVEVEAPAPQAPPALQAASGPDPEIVAAAKALAEELQSAADALAPPELPGDLGGLLSQAVPSGGEGGGGEAGAAHAVLVQELDGVMGGIFNSVNSIIEALSFQDLSGQAIYKIVRLLTDFQVQLLAMVVSFGYKLKAKAEDTQITAGDSEKMAQEQVDKALESIGAATPGGEGGMEESKLDQDSVDSLLGEMGF